jgi:hypothetical protein
MIEADGLFSRQNLVLVGELSGMRSGRARTRAAELLELFELADAPLVGGQVSVSADGLRLSAAVDSAPGLATALVRALDQAGLLVDN